jgi:hypothetical protein
MVRIPAFQRKTDKAPEWIMPQLCGLNGSCSLEETTTKSVPHFLSYKVNGRAHRVRVERLIFGG